MKLHTTRLAILAAALFALPACSDRSGPMGPDADATSPNLKVNQTKSSPFVQTVTGTATSEVTGLEVGTFTGTVEVVKFVNDAGELQAVVKVTGQVVDNTTGAVLETLKNVVDVTDAVINQAECEILDLEIGPIHLDLLGLVVDIAPIDIEITAQPGPGNLLGNLLCAIAGLLDPGGLEGVLQGVIDLLNRIIDLL